MVKKKNENQLDNELNTNNLSFISNILNKLIDRIPEVNTYKQLIAFSLVILCLIIMTCAIKGYMEAVVILCISIGVGIVFVIFIYAIRSSKEQDNDTEENKIYKSQADNIVTDVTDQEFNSLIQNINKCINELRWPGFVRQPEG